MKHPLFKPDMKYIVQTGLREYYDILFKIRLMINYEIYSKITPYIVQNKDKSGKIKSLTEVSIMNKILVTRDINFDKQNEILIKSRILEGLPTRLKVIHSNVIIVVNDDLSPLNIKSEDIKWYSIIDREFLDNHITIYNNYNFILPSTLYCSITLNKLMLILSDSKYSNETGKSKIKLFLEQELNNGIFIDFCFKNEIKEYINEYYYDHKYKLELWKKLHYKLPLNRISNELIVKNNELHHLFDLDNVLVCFKNMFWQNILYLSNIYNIKIWKGKEDGMNFNACALFTMIHNALVLSSNSEKMVLMNKIINNNENLKTCKEILEEKVFGKLKDLINKIDDLILTNTSIEKYLNQIMEIVLDKHNKFDEVSNNMFIYGEKIKEISYEIVDKQEMLFYSDDEEDLNKPEVSKKDLKLQSYDLSKLQPESLEFLIKKMIVNYNLNYFWNFLFLLEMLIIKLYKVLNKVDIRYNYQVKNSSFVYVYLKIIFYYLFYSNKYFEYVQQLDENYKNNLIDLPDNYGEIAHYIAKDILKIIEGNSCYCEGEFKIENKFSLIRFNLLFSEFEIKLNLLNMFNSLEKKTCTLDQSLVCKTKNINISNVNTENKRKPKINFDSLPDSIKKLILANKNRGNVKRKYHTSTRIKNKIIEMKESDFLNKESKEQKNSESFLNILEKIKYLTSSSYDSK